MGPSPDLVRNSAEAAEHKWEGICCVSAISAFVILFILFYGEPDIHDAIIHMLMN